MKRGVLVSSVGRRVQLIAALRAAMSAQGWSGPLVTADCADSVAGSYFGDEHVRVPPVGSGDYIEALREVCERYAIDLVVPTIDSELGLFAEVRGSFSTRGCSIAVSSAEAIAICDNKLQTRDFLQAQAIPTPRTLPWQGGTSSSERLGYPVHVKPINGSRSVGARRIETSQELLAIKDPDSLIVQEYISGPEFTVSCFVGADGNSVVEVPRLRVGVRAGEMSLGRTVRHPQIEALARRTVEALSGAFGPINVQIIDGPNGPLVIEINARFGGGDPLAWTAGADIPRWLLAEVEEAGTATRGPAWIEGVCMTRFDQAVYTFPNGDVHVG